MMSNQKKKIYLLLAGFLSLLILFFSLIPVSEFAGITNSGIFMHIFSYFLLSLLIKKSMNSFKTGFLIAMVFGFLIELVQYTVPYRFFELSDVFFNSLGAFLVFFFKA